MKIIELLNKIANGEEVPKKIKWHGVIFTFVDETYYVDYKNDLDCSLFRHDDDMYKVTNMLDDEVEIIEEDKEIEKIGYLKYCESPVESILHRKIDELIDEVNKLKKG